jgi:isopenicillin N synthase-like dioxygenase
MYADRKIAALCHRVRAASVGRISAAFFLEVRPDVRLPNGELATERWTRLMAKIRAPKDAA